MIRSENEAIYASLDDLRNRNFVISDTNFIETDPSISLLIAILIQLSHIHNITVPRDIGKSSLLKIEKQETDYLIRLLIELEVQANLSARSARKRKSLRQKIRNFFCV